MKEFNITGTCFPNRHYMGYLVSFCFNKNKQIGVKTVRVGDREIVEGVV